mgnify:CR=1 FL=1
MSSSDSPFQTPRGPGGGDDDDDDGFGRPRPRGPSRMPQGENTTARGLTNEGYRVPVAPGPTDGGTTFVYVINGMRNVSSSISSATTTINQGAQIVGGAIGLGVQAVSVPVQALGSVGYGVGSVMLGGPVLPNDEDNEEQPKNGKVWEDNQLFQAQT